MNQSNENELEIIDSIPNTSRVSDSYSRYPLATNPTAELQKHSYKDWLNKSGEQDSLDSENPGASSTGRTAISIAIKLSTSLLTIIGFPFAGQVGQLWGMALDTLWPDEGENPWELFMRQVEELIDQRIEAYARNRALAELEGLGNNLEIYQQALEEWKQDPTNPLTQNRVVDRFRILDALFTRDMPSFRVVGFEVPLLTVYASAANLHLLLLRDSSIYGREWGLTETNFEQNYQRLLGNIRDYSNHCVQWFENGMNRLRGSNATQWIAFNRFRREMTLMVLDISALFSNYDIRRYPVGVNSELTREIYTDPVGVHSLGAGTGNLIPNWQDMSQPFSVLENVGIRMRRAFTWLEGINIFTGRFSGWNTPQLYWQGHFNVSRETHGIGNIYSPVYGDQISVIDTRYLSLSFTDIFNILSDATSQSMPLSPNTRYFGVANSTLAGVFNTQQNPIFSQVSYHNPLNWGGQHIITNLPGEDGWHPSISTYSHRLSYITVLPAGTVGTILLHAWTSSSVDRFNTLIPNVINQIPAIKGFNFDHDIQVMDAIGLTGGQVVRMSNSRSFSLVYSSQVGSRYRIRIRYANRTSSINTTSRIHFSISNSVSSILLPGTSSTIGNQAFSHQEFGYAEFPGIFTTSAPNTSIRIIYEGPADEATFIDRIEFIPENVAFEYEGQQNLEKAQKAVSALFNNDSKNSLKKDSSEYEVDQVENLVECVSDELYAKEKMILLDEVKYAKQLCKSRNLLQNGDFESPDGFGENGWKTSNNITTQADSPIFKGNYLYMPSANSVNNQTFPTYIYQKIDESKLKPYTRYKVRGFVGSSKDLELLVTRYAEEVDAIMNVPNDITYPGPTPSCGDFNRCKPQLPPMMKPGCKEESDFDELSDYCHSRVAKKHVKCHDTHEFEFHIDTGKTDLNKNLGIWVMFKISSENGYATLDDLEVIEYAPLVGESLGLVKKRENKWKHTMEIKCSETKKAYDAAKLAVDALFTDCQYEKLKYETIISNIILANNLVQSIPYVYNEWLPDVPGMNYDLYTELKNRITQAYYLYDQRNVIKNGDFDEGLKHWHVSGDVEVQKIDGTSVLVIPNWSTQVVENLCLQHNHGYVLRVTAKKEGYGSGYVTISDCSDNIEKIEFTSYDYLENNSQSYIENNQLTKEQCDYIEETQNNYVTENQLNYLEYAQSDFVTKTIDIFPDTDKVRIEIGETEGTFKVVSVELICMEG